MVNQAGFNYILSTKCTQIYNDTEWLKALWIEKVTPGKQ